MATKNISMTEDAYKLLAQRKMMVRESFSEVIVREFGGKEKLKELFGILKGKKGEEFEKSIMDSRRIHAELRKKRHKRLMEEFNR